MCYTLIVDKDIRPPTCVGNGPEIVIVNGTIMSVDYVIIMRIKRNQELRRK